VLRLDKRIVSTSKPAVLESPIHFSRRERRVVGVNRRMMKKILSVPPGVDSARKALRDALDHAEAAQIRCERLLMTIALSALPVVYPANEVEPLKEPLHVDPLEEPLDELMPLDELGPANDTRPD
jgi:hypothetical protein